MSDPFRHPSREGRPPRVPLSDPGPMLWALRDLGYLAPDDPIGEGDGLSGAARAAIVRYGQIWLTGPDLDPVRPGDFTAVADHLATRFCAVADIVGDDVAALGRSSADPSDGGRLGGVLTWTFDANGLTGTRLKDAAAVAMTPAFAQWSAALPSFSFRHVADVADITVRLSGARLAPYLGRAGGVRAAAAPLPSAWVQFDLSAGWTAPALFRVALHEIGHVVGLAHSTDPSSIMFPIDVGVGTLDPASVTALRSIHDS